MNIRLHHVANVDIAGGYWEGRPNVKASFDAAVATLEDAKSALQSWIARHGLGGGNMARDCGDVTDDSGVLIGRFSYNGRWWPIEAA